MVTCAELFSAGPPDICNCLWRYCCSIVYGDTYNIQPSSDPEDVDDAERLYDVTKESSGIIIRVIPDTLKSNGFSVWDQDIKQDKGTVYRRQGARRWKKCKRFNGHTFEAKRFGSQRAICAFCSDRIWGIGGPGYKCVSCRLLVHKRCHRLVDVVCHEPPSTPRTPSSRTTSTSDTTPIIRREQINGICTPTFLTPRSTPQPTPAATPSVTPALTPCDTPTSIVPKAMPEDLTDTDTEEDDDDDAEMSVRLQLLVHNEHEVSDVSFARQSDVTFTASCTVGNKNGGGGGDRISTSSSLYFDCPRSHDASASISDFQLLKVIGRGSYAKVLLAEHRRSKRHFAVKVMKKDVIGDDEDIEWILTEKNVLTVASLCPFLVGMHSCFQTKSRLFFVMEYVAGGDMMTHMQREKRIPEEHVRFYSGEIALALNFLHTRGIIYRDLKLDNVLLDKDGHVKLTDYGMCKDGLKPGEKTSTFCGTPNYIAPEILKGDDYGCSVDWWALGVLMFEMMAGRSPFDIVMNADNPDQVTERYLFHVILERTIRIPRSLTVKARQVLQGFLSKIPEERLGCDPETGLSDIKAHTFYKTIDWEKLECQLLKPPFLPELKDQCDVRYFDKQFTDEPVILSPDDKSMLKKINQSEFEGFDYTHPACNGVTSCSRHNSL